MEYFDDSTKVWLKEKKRLRFDRFFHQDTEDALTYYLRDVSRFPLLSPEEEILLIHRAQAGEKAALDEFLSRNLRLVISLAKNFLDQELPFLDLIQAGNLGLIRAVEKFDHKRGFRFSVYAAWWIRRDIRTAIAENKYLLSVPVSVVELIYKMRRIVHQLVQEFKRDPTIDEIAERMQLGRERILELQILDQPLLSFSTPSQLFEEEDEVYTFVDLLKETEALPPDIQIEQEQDCQIEAALSTLTNRERQVIEMRYGLFGNAPHTLSELSSSLKLTYVRIQQLHKSGRDKLLKCLQQVSWSGIFTPDV